MKRGLGLAVVAVALLATVTGANAKAPPNGFELCGPTSCISIAQDDAEQLAISLFYGGGAKEANAPTTEPSSFLILHWAWPDQPVQSAFYVPGIEALRVIGNPGSSGYLGGRTHWLQLDDATSATMTRLGASLQPFAVPTPTRVMVGGRVARDPASYLRVWTVGAPAPRVYSGGWLRLRLTSAAPSPWSDAATQVFVARRGGWLARDGTFFRVPKTFAARIRARKSLNF